MRYSDEVIEEVRLSNDIVEVIGNYTILKQKGNSYFGLCPFHRETTPSFSVSADKQLYHCFGCGAAGNVYSFIMKIENYDFIDSLKFLAERVNYTLPEPKNNSYFDDKVLKTKENLYKIHKIVARHFYENLNTKQGIKAIEYLNKRKINNNTRIKYGIGYSILKRDDVYSFLKSKGYDDEIILESGLVLKDKQNKFYDRFFGRLMFPIIDVQGRIIGFGGRIIEDLKNTPKYLNSPDTLIFNKSNNLYSMNFARFSKNKELIIVEGYMDVISIHQIGVTNVVANLGTAFNKNHVKVLKKYAKSITLLFDSDDAGINASLRAIDVLKDEGLNIKVLQVTNAKDPDEYIKKFGSESFKNLIKKSKNYITFLIETQLKNFDLNDTNQKIEFTKIAAKIISSVSNSIEREVFIKDISNITGLSFEAISTEIQKLSDDFSINLKKQRYTNYKHLSNNNKIDEARKNLLALVALNNNIFNLVKDFINPDEFIEDCYINLFKVIIDMHNNNNNIYPAEIINKFQNKEDQNKIASIFMTHFDFDNIKNIEKIINDQLKIIKKAYLENLIINEVDPQNLNKLITNKKNIEKIYINLT